MPRGLRGSGRLMWAGEGRCPLDGCRAAASRPLFVTTAQTAEVDVNLGSKGECYMLTGTCLRYSLCEVVLKKVGEMMFQLGSRL